MTTVVTMDALCIAQQLEAPVLFHGAGPGDGQGSCSHASCTIIEHPLNSLYTNPKVQGAREGGRRVEYKWSHL